MKKPEHDLAAVAVPGVLAVFSNKPRIPNFPLVQRLKPVDQIAADDLDVPLKVTYRVGAVPETSQKLEGKVFRRIDNTLIQETPVGPFARLSVALHCDAANPTIAVNPFYHSAGRLTVGNVHSCGWLVRDLCNIHLLSNRKTLLHAAGLKHGNRTALIIGLSNTGKTTTVVNLVQSRDAEYYGDDLVVTDGKYLFPCPHVAANINPSHNTGAKYAFIQWARRTIPFFENYGADIPFSISDHLGYEHCATPAKVTDIIFLIRSEQPADRRVSNDEAAQLLLASNRTEFTYATSPVFCAAEYLGIGFNLTHLVDREAHLMGQLVRNSRCRLVEGGHEQFREAVLQALAL